ncbi:MAG: AAA family ATPase [Candidatus Diapherotrites archaeon]|nr:AAA family ATPase [Candidatus Diapherotrites archaeon]
MDLFDSKKKFSEPIEMSDYLFSLERQLEGEKTEKNVYVARVTQLELEVQQLKKQLEELTKPAFLVAVVTELINESQVIVKSANGLEFLVELRPELGLLEVGERLTLNQRTLSVIGKLPSAKDMHVHSMEVIEKPKITFEQIGGLTDEIRELEEIVILPLLYPEKFDALGIEMPKGILLHGAPGTGKTLLAKAVANKANATFISLTGSQLVKKFIGEGARMVREMFALASQKKPSIIFIDELDAVGAARNDSINGDREVQRTLMQLLAEMDGFTEKNGVCVMAATNRLDIIDSALLRPGRFDRIIETPYPNEKARTKIFEIHSKKMNLNTGIDFTELSAKTEFFSGADIKAVCIEAALTSLRENKEKVSMNDFLKGIKKIKKEEKNENETKMFS